MLKNFLFFFFLVSILFAQNLSYAGGGKPFLKEGVIYDPYTPKKVIVYEELSSFCSTLKPSSKASDMTTCDFALRSCQYLLSEDYYNQVLENPDICKYEGKDKNHPDVDEYVCHGDKLKEVVDQLKSKYSDFIKKSCAEVASANSSQDSSAQKEIPSDISSGLASTEPEKEVPASNPLGNNSPATATPEASGCSMLANVSNNFGFMNYLGMFVGLFFITMKRFMKA